MGEVKQAGAGPVGEAVAWQWRALEDGQPRVGWHPVGYGDESELAWTALAIEDKRFTVERRPLYANPARDAAEAALAETRERLEKAKDLLWQALNLPYSEPVHSYRDAIRAARVALTGDAQEAGWRLEDERQELEAALSMIADRRVGRARYIIEKVLRLRGDRA